MVFDYEHPEIPFDFWAAQAEPGGYVVGTVPELIPDYVDDRHVTILPEDSQGMNLRS